jgi:hypothetical protein
LPAPVRYTAGQYAGPRLPDLRVREETDVADRMTAGPVETVRVGADEFRAARVDREIPAWVRKGKYWYAPGIGLIRMDDDMKLASFTPGDARGFFNGGLLQVKPSVAR